MKNLLITLSFLFLASSVFAQQTPTQTIVRDGTDNAAQQNVTNGNAHVNVGRINDVAPSMGAGNTGTGVQRVIEATDSQLSSGVGATSDAAATAGGTGSINAKLRLLTDLLNQVLTELGQKLESATIGAAMPSVGSVAGFSDGTNMVAGRVTTSTPGASDPGIIVRNVNPNLAADNSTLSTAKVPVLPGTVSTSAPTWTNGNQSALSLQTDGSVRAAITNTVTVTDGAGALNVIVDSSALPTGAATAANQDGIIRDGTGDTTQANVISGSLSVNCTNCSGSGASHIDNAAFTGSTDDVAPLGALYDTTPPAVTDGNAGVVRMNSNRALLVDGSAVTQPVSGTVTVTATNLDVQIGGSDSLTIGTFPDNEPFNIAQMNGVTVSMGVGASGTGTQRVASLLHDGTDTAQVTATAGGSLQVECTSGCGGSGGTSIADDAAFTPGTTSVTPAGAMFDDVTPDSVNEGDAGVVRMSANRNLYTTLRDAAGNERGANVNASGELQVAITANSAVNVAQINGVTPLMGAGNTGTGSPRVTIATDQAGLPGLGVYVEDAAETAGGNLSMSGTVRRDTAASSAGTTGDNATLNTDATGLLWTRTIDPCSSTAKTFLAINISTATTTEITPSLAGANTYYYVCSLVLVTAGANNIALVDDDSDGCGSVTSGLAGGTTSGSGFNMAANSGMTFGNGMGSVFKTAGANRVICLVTSAAVQLSGTMTVVAAP